MRSAGRRTRRRPSRQPCRSPHDRPPVARLRLWGRRSADREHPTRLPCPRGPAQSTRQARKPRSSFGGMVPSGGLSSTRLVGPSWQPRQARLNGIREGHRRKGKLCVRATGWPHRGSLACERRSGSSLAPQLRRQRSHAKERGVDAHTPKNVAKPGAPTRRDCLPSAGLWQTRWFRPPWCARSSPTSLR